MTWVQLAQWEADGEGQLILTGVPGSVVRQIFITNSTAGALTFDLYHDDDGQVFTPDTQIMEDKSVPANGHVILDVDIALGPSSSSIGANAPVGLTFTLYGEVNPATKWRQLGQVRPSGTSATQFVTNAPGWTVRQILVSNADESPHTFDLYHDADGNSSANGQRILNDYPVPANTSVMIDVALAVGNDAGEIQVAASFANALTFTAYGELA